MMRYHTPDPVANAQRMLDELDALHYAACRLCHDHGHGPALGATRGIIDAALVLMREFPTIEGPESLNRQWFAMVEEHRAEVVA